MFLVWSLGLLALYLHNLFDEIFDRGHSSFKEFDIAKRQIIDDYRPFCVIYVFEML